MNNDSNNKTANISVFIKGMIIGATMLVPGVSGGSMAMILGIYNDLISSVSSFMKDKKNSLIFLLTTGIGGILGVYLLSGQMLSLLERYTLPTMYFFMGAVIGSIPMIYSKSELRHFSIRGVLYIIIGIAIVILISMLPVSSSQQTAGEGMQSSLYLLLAGLVAAVALVLPGISVSYLLLLMGLYDETMRAISDLSIGYLIPLAVGLLLGIILTTKVIEKAMTSFPQPTYLIILGFIIGSLAEIFPGIPSGTNILMCTVTLMIGAAIIYLISRKEIKN